MPPRKKQKQAADEAAIKLSYWPGRGLMEVPRFLLAIAGKEFEDFRATSGVDDMGGALDCNLGRLPVLNCADGSIGQSAAINYYVASECGLLGASTFEAAQILAFAEHIKELKSAYGSLVPFGTEPSKEAIKTFFDSKEASDYSGPADRSQRSSRMLLWFMGRMERLVGDDGYAVGGQMSLADVLLYNAFADTLVSDGDLPAYRKEPFSCLKKVDAALKKHPKLKACIASVANHPNVKEWLAKRTERPYSF